MPITSVSMWPASDSNASELVANAAINCTTKNAAMTANAAIKRPSVTLPRPRRDP